MNLGSIESSLTAAAGTLGGTGVIVLLAVIAVGLTVFGILRAVKWFKKGIS